MKISRDWATPLTMGVFLLMALTGLLMFFHWDSGMNKLAHEWLGWLMVAGAGVHVAANWPAFKRHLLGNRTGQLIMVLSTLLVAATFMPQPGPSGQGGVSPPVMALRALVAAPLKDVAPLTGCRPEALLAELQAAGYPLQSVEQTLGSVTGGQREREGAAIRLMLRPCP